MYGHGTSPEFAFLIHPRDVSDMLTWRGAPLLRQYSEDDDDFARKVTSMEPVVVGEVRTSFGGSYGELVGVPRLPAQLLVPSGRFAVAAAVGLAADRGAGVIGLGALTAPATMAGRTLVAGLPPGPVLTTGNAYTAAVARSNVVEAVDRLGLGAHARVAVVGATGSVGVGASRLLALTDLRITLVGRSEARVRTTLGDLEGRAAIAGSLLAVGDADVVLVVTSAASALVQPEHVRPGAVVIDMTQPTNIAAEAFPAFRQKDVLVVAGGLVRIPGYRVTQELPTGSDTATFACLAETFLLAREGLREHSVGVPTVEAALRMERIAARHGVRPSPLELDDPTAWRTSLQVRRRMRRVQQEGALR